MRVRSIQPDFTDDMLCADQETVSSRHTINAIHAVIWNWSLLQQDLPDGFADNLSIKSVARQVVPAVVVRVQRSSRRLVSDLIPFDGTKLSNRRFSTNDLFGLSEIVNPCEFPDTKTTMFELIEGNESLKVCDGCAGAGENLCTNCRGAGTLICKACRGGGQSECRYCRGQGQILVDGIETQRCGRCAGKGTAQCAQCAGRGGKDCTGCENGINKCTACNASGQMRLQWYLETATHTETYHRLVCRNGWVDEDHSVAKDAVLLRHHDWSDPQLISSTDTRAICPDVLVGAATTTINSAKREASDCHRDTGMRLEVRASFIYHVEVLHEGQVSDFFVRGCSNTVTSRKVRKKQKNLLGRLSEKYVVTDEERAYAEAVAQGRTFLTDTRGLGDDLRQREIELEISDTGYVIPEDELANPHEIRLNFEYDRSNQPVLRTTIDLGAAERHRFPEYMAANQLLSIGMLGLLERNNRTSERLVLVDSRFYESMSAEAYFNALELMSFEAQRLIDSEFNLRSAPRIDTTAKIKRICEYIKCNLRVISINAKVSIKHAPGKALLLFTLGNGRQQTVLLSLKQVNSIGVVELKSRCRTAHDAQTVRSALKNNMLSPCGGFGLDATTEPPTIDLIQRLVALDGEPNYSELLHNLSSVVHRADVIEHKQSDVDEF